MRWDLVSSLKNILRESHVWICVSDKASRRKEIEEEIAAIERDELCKLCGEISTFPTQSNNTLEDSLLAYLDTINDHYDGFIWPEWSQINVLGVLLTDKLRLAFTEIGAAEFEQHETGFNAKKI